MLSLSIVSPTRHDNKIYSDTDVPLKLIKVTSSVRDLLATCSSISKLTLSSGIRQVFSRARAEAPCLLILEDLDSLITDGNRSFFLNEVDGLEDNDGLLLVSRNGRAKFDLQIGTTNHFDKLDPALSNRPSRFDRK